MLDYDDYDVCGCCTAEGKLLRLACASSIGSQGDGCTMKNRYCVVTYV
jgi:hypothetical protein